MRWDELNDTLGNYADSKEHLPSEASTKSQMNVWEKIITGTKNNHLKWTYWYAAASIVFLIACGIMFFGVVKPLRHQIMVSKLAIDSLQENNHILTQNLNQTQQQLSIVLNTPPKIDTIYIETPWQSNLMTQTTAIAQIKDTTAIEYIDETAETGNYDNRYIICFKHNVIDDEIVTSWTVTYNNPNNTY